MPAREADQDAGGKVRIVGEIVKSKVVGGKLALVRGLVFKYYPLDSNHKFYTYIYINVYT